jgi:acyl carrier protein
MRASEQRSNEIISSLREFLAAGKPDETSAIEDDENLFDAGVIDSFQLVMLVTFIQSEFAIDFDFDELTEENFSTLSEMSRFISGKHERTD